MPRRRAALAAVAALAVLPVLVLALAAGGARADAVSLAAVLDNTLFDDAAVELSNGSGPALFAGRTNRGRVRRALVRFDVAAAVPVGARIDSVRLRLVCSNLPDTRPFAVTLHRLRADWGEGAAWADGGAGALAQPGDATWRFAFYPVARWSGEGGDFDAAPRAATWVGALGEQFWASPELAADVQQWLEFPGANFGWIVLGDETASGTARRFHSREVTPAGFGPRLEVHFTPRTHAVLESTWGRVKEEFR